MLGFHVTPSQSISFWSSEEDGIDRNGAETNQGATCISMTFSPVSPPLSCCPNPFCPGSLGWGLPSIRGWGCCSGRVNDLLLLTNT